MKKIHSLLLPMLCFLHINAVPAGVPLWQVLGLTDDSVITTESKLDHISLEFSGVFTALQDITDILASDISKLDDFNVVINTSFAISQLDAISSGVDVVQSLVDALEGCGVAGAISQADIGITGYTITSPGHYYLTENITFNPIAVSQTAIIINANNVYLDLNGFTITQGNVTATAGGILVLDNRRNIKILNGIIRSMSGQTITLNTNVNNVYISGIQALSAGLPGGGPGVESSDGIEANGGSNYVFNDIVIQNAQDDGLDINQLFNFIIKNSTISFNGSTGIIVDDSCSRGVIINCSVENNEDDGISRALTGAGGTGVVVTGCVLNRNGAAGMSANNSWVIENCNIFGNVGRGIQPLASNAQTVIKNNEIAQNASGISVQNNCFIFRNTLIQNGSNNIPSAGGTAGSILGNYAFNTTDAANYVTSGGTTVNRTIVNTTGSFISQPVFWRNISAIP